MSHIKEAVLQHIIFYGVLGSRAYGLHHAKSDYDYRGVAIAPKECYLGLDNFEQVESKNPDTCIFDIKKYFKLSLEANPNIIEYQWLDSENVLTSTPTWEKILENRELFLSKRVKHRYLGYSYSQLKRVKSHRHWLLNPVLNKPTRTEFGLPEAESLSKELIGSIDMVIKDCLKDNLYLILDNAADDISRINIRNYIEFDLREALEEAFADFVFTTSFNKLVNNLDVMVTIGQDHFTSEVMSVYAKEKMYSTAMNSYKQYEEWKQKRNPERSILEEKFGFDTKHVGHVFRLLIQGEQLLTEGKLDVKLQPEHKEFVLAIKEGKYKYDEILEMAENKMKSFDDLYKNSKLPHSPNYAKANELLVSILQENLY